MKRKGQKNLTYTQRLQIETLYNAKLKQKEIAKIVGVCLRTIQYELKRGEYFHLSKTNYFWYGTKFKKTKKYSANKANDRYKLLCSSKGRPLKLGNDYAFVEYIEQRVVKDKISACAVLGEIKHKSLPFQTQISKTTLYRYIKIGIFEHIKLEKRKKEYKKVKIKRASKGTSIEKRPIEIKNRNSFGHWEGDCVCGSTKTALFVMTERLTRQELIFKIKRQNQKSVLNCIDSLEQHYKKDFTKIFKSVTFDNGSEFLDYKAIEQSQFGEYKRTKTYYCHPYCSCERGTNERLNREIRRLIPKGTDLSRYTDEQIKQVENWVNNYPREIFGYATSKELFKKQLELLN